MKILNEKDLRTIVSNSISLREVGRKLGVTNQVVKANVKKYNIDFSHFKHGKGYTDIVGMTFGLLTVNSVEKIGDRVFATCSCKCGKSKTVRADGLKDCHYISCGCHSKNRWNMVGNKNPAFTGIGEIPSAWFGELKRNAKRRGIDFSLTIEYLWGLYLKQEKKCALTGEQIYFGRVRRHQETNASLDRINNSIGYSEGNVRWVLKPVNIMRGSYDTEYYIQICNLIAKTNPLSSSTLQVVNNYKNPFPTKTLDK